MAGTLFLVSVPIGNEDDISLRALKLLESSDYVVCEEWKVGRRRLAYYKIKNELLSLNEHNSKESTQDILKRLKKGHTIALMSDAGTPLFSDPGFELVQACYRSKIKVTAVSGASSLMSALILSGFSLKDFYYYGWLPRKRDERNAALKHLRNPKSTTVIMETPYRLNALIESIYQNFDKEQQIALCMDLSKENEEILRGRIADVYQEIKHRKMKRDFILILAGKNEIL